MTHSTTRKLARELVLDLEGRNKNEKIRKVCTFLEGFFNHHPLCACTQIEAVGGPLDGKDVGLATVNNVIVTPAEGHTMKDVEENPDHAKLDYYKLAYRHVGQVTEEEAEKIKLQQSDRDLYSCH